MSSVFFNKGENCIAAGRLFVEDSIHDQFVQRVVSCAAGPGYCPLTGYRALAGRARAGPGTIQLVGGALTSLPWFLLFPQETAAPQLPRREQQGPCSGGALPVQPGRADMGPGRGQSRCSPCTPRRLPTLSRGVVSCFPTPVGCSSSDWEVGCRGALCCPRAPPHSHLPARLRHPSPRHQAQVSLHGGCIGGFSLEGRFGTRMWSQESEPCVWTLFRGQRLVSEKAYVGGGSAGDWSETTAPRRP